MLVIREQQLDTLQENAEADFITRIMIHLRENQDAETYELEDAELERRVKIGVEKAREYDLTWEKPIVFFVRVMFTISPNFDRQWSIQTILTDIYEEPNEKMDFVTEYATDDDWEEAALLSDDWRL